MIQMHANRVRRNRTVLFNRPTELGGEYANIKAAVSSRLSMHTLDAAERYSRTLAPRLLKWRHLC